MVSPGAPVGFRGRVSGPIAPRFTAPRFGAAGFAGSRTFAGAARPSAARVRFAPGGVVATRGLARSRVFASRVNGPRVFVSPFRFARPFYAFRPRSRVAVGLWVGYPIAYPYYDLPYDYGAYPYPYPYPYTPPYTPPYVSYPASPYPYSGYGDAPDANAYPTAAFPPARYATQQYAARQYPSGSVGVQSGQNSGGISFEVTPNTARVSVDGTAIGSVAEYSPTSRPLTLLLGRHHIELRAAGYETMEFDVEISPGQVIPYSGAMQRSD